MKEPTKQRRKLNLLMSYPVKWTMYEVMRDYIQNFYDVVGYKDFKKRFIYDYDRDKGSLTLSIRNAFNIEYLFYMGVSSKRNEEKTYAGRYGEGFKIASLVAFRDYNLDIVMESQDWRLQVVQEEGTLDGKNVSCLAYDISKRNDNGQTIMTLMNITDKNYDDFLRALKAFFYIGNPLIGNEIAVAGEYGVYDCTESDGIIFLAYQNRFRMKKCPIVVLNPYTLDEDDDRDRAELTPTRAKKCFIKVIEKLNGHQSYSLLLRLEGFWGNGLQPRTLFSISDIIKNLIDNILKSPSYNEIKKDFCNRYKEKLVANFHPVTPPYRKRLAKYWFAHWDYRKDRRIVKSSFHGLDIDTIDELCEKENGFEIIRRPTEREAEYIDLLNKFARDCIGDLVVYDSFPTCMVITNDEAVSMGLAKSFPVIDNIENTVGMKIKKEIVEINIKASILNRDGFAEAVTTYMHELLHQFGEDNDKNFHLALMYMCKRLMNSIPQLDEYEEQWNAV